MKFFKKFMGESLHEFLEKFLDESPENVLDAPNYSLKNLPENP